MRLHSAWETREEADCVSVRKPFVTLFSGDRDLKCFTYAAATFPKYSDEIKMLPHFDQHTPQTLKCSCYRLLMWQILHVGEKVWLCFCAQNHCRGSLAYKLLSEQNKSTSFSVLKKNEFQGGPSIHALYHIESLTGQCMLQLLFHTNSLELFSKHKL